MCFISIFLPTRRNILVKDVILAHNSLVLKSTNGGALIVTIPKLIPSADFVC